MTHSPNRRHLLGSMGATALAALLPASVRAAELARADRRFVEQAAADGMAEVELGRLAQQRAASDEVRRFGERMVQDHGRTGEELKALAGTKGIAAPADLPAAHRRHLDRLGKLSGADFDREYTKLMVEDHRKAVALFRQQVRAGKDNELREFATRTLPTLQEHLQHVQSLSGGVRGSGSGSAPARGASRP